MEQMVTVCSTGLVVLGALSTLTLVGEVTSRDAVCKLTHGRGRRSDKLFHPSLEVRMGFIGTGGRSRHEMIGKGREDATGEDGVHRSRRGRVHRSRGGEPAGEDGVHRRRGEPAGEDGVHRSRREGEGEVGPCGG